MKVCLGSDHAGYHLKEEIKKWVLEWGFQTTDFGAFSEEAVDYPDIAGRVSKAVASGDYERGILVCGTGIGMCIAANKVRGVRAALVHDVFSATATRQHNNSNVLTMGARVIGFGLAREIVRTWLYATYEGGRHNARIKKITDLEEEYLPKC